MFASERMAICFRLGQGYNLYLALLPYCLGALLSLLSAAGDLHDLGPGCLTLLANIMCLLH